VSLQVALRVLHVVAGFGALVVGPAIMRASKRPGLHTRGGHVYFGLVTVVCLSAIALAFVEWSRLSFFFWIAIGTYAFALPGFLAAKARWPHWVLIHAIGVTSSYVAIATAFLVNNLVAITGIHLPFAARALGPMFTGTCAVGWLAYQIHKGKRPNSTADPALHAKQSATPGGGAA